MLIIQAANFARARGTRNPHLWGLFQESTFLPRGVAESLQLREAGAQLRDELERDGREVLEAHPDQLQDLADAHPVPVAGRVAELDDGGDALELHLLGAGQPATAAILTVSFTLLFGLLCFAMPEQRIAEYNITRYENGTLSELDVDMLCGLSEDAYLVMTKHPDALRRAGQWDEFVRRAKIRTDEIYRESKDKSWNLPAQILIQRVHVDIPHEE